MISILPLNAMLQAPSAGQVSPPTETVLFSDLLDGEITQPTFVPENSLQIYADALGEKGFAARLQDQKCLFTFTELGMFGRHHAQFMAAGKLDVGVEPEVTAEASIAPPGKLSDAPPAGSNQALSMKGAPLLPLSVNNISVRNRETLLAPVQRLAEWQTENNADPFSAEVEIVEQYSAIKEGVTPQAVPSSVSMGNSGIASDAEALSPLEGGAPMRVSSIALKSQPPPLPLDLAVLGPSEALVVSIRSPVDAGESRVRLLQAVESIAAEFGMDVAELRINGSPFGQISSSVKGGSNGGHAS